MGVSRRCWRWGLVIHADGSHCEVRMTSDSSSTSLNCRFEILVIINQSLAWFLSPETLTQTRSVRARCCLHRWPVLDSFQVSTVSAGGLTLRRQSPTSREHKSLQRNEFRGQCCCDDWTDSVFVSGKDSCTRDALFGLKPDRQKRSPSGASPKRTHAVSVTK